MWVTTRTRSPNTVLLRVFWGLDTVHWCNNGQFDRLTVKCNECGILLHKKTPGRLIQTVPLNDIERTVLTLDSSETSEWIYRRAIQPTGSNQTMPIPQGTRFSWLSSFFLVTKHFHISEKVERVNTHVELPNVGPRLSAWALRAQFPSRDGQTPAEPELYFQLRKVANFRQKWIASPKVKDSPLAN